MSRPVVKPLGDSDEEGFELEYESRVGVDVADVPPLSQELGAVTSDGWERSPYVATAGRRDGSPPSDAEEEEREKGGGREGEESPAISPSRSPSKRSRRASDVLDESRDSTASGSWRVKCDGDSDALPYLEEDEFASDEEEEEEEEWLGGRHGWGRFDGVGDVSLSIDKDSIEYEFETRKGIDVAIDAHAEEKESARASAAHQKPDPGKPYAMRPRTTINARQHTKIPPQAQKVGGMDFVCDPVLANSQAQLRVGEKCRRGIQVVLVAEYARKEGLMKCLGLIGVLQRRAQV